MTDEPTRTDEPSGTGDRTRSDEPSATDAPVRTDTPTRADEPILTFDDVRLAFAGVRAIDGVSFTVGRQELFAVIGPNGAGKTSIFNVLSGVYRPQAGRVVFDGVDLIGRRPHEIAALGLARTFQNVELFANLTVLENLLLGRHHHIRYGPLSALLWRGRARREELAARAAVEEIVDFLELEQWRRMPVGLLPYGVQKRVELGRALAMEPKLLLLDEPVGGMNLEETEDMARYILDVREELGIPMVLVEHDMGLVMDLADRVLVVDFGQPVATGTPAEIQHHPDVIRAYLGEVTRT
ncbi:ABC transporter ATP-binding protein [Micromonospora thermarum]|uniref:ABC transporter ATP-binding protein n=1 Tax=Micromonospora thermarum TaxID=2720024 RepID=A0ABX0ZGQ2_9ACTN|nr:ABC transporter ATP-binding protein [Micromonospora thermarum]NJP35138.1 ABC transporter ATP-binding protein [Micromonospora thermarum]